MTGKPSTKLFYKIGEVCRLTGIKPHILRYWESEFTALNPRKNRGGQRVYQQKDLDMVFRIKRMLYEEGFTIAGARKKLSGRGEPSGGGGAGDTAAEPETEVKTGELQGGLRQEGPAGAGENTEDDSRLADALVRFRKEIIELLDIIND